MVAVVGIGQKSIDEAGEVQRKGSKTPDEAPYPTYRAEAVIKSVPPE